VKDTVVTAPDAPEAVKPEPRIVSAVELSPRDMPASDSDVIVGLATTTKFCELVVADMPPVRLLCVMVTGYVPTELTIVRGTVIPTVVDVGAPLDAVVVPIVELVARFELVENVPVAVTTPFQGLTAVGSPPASIAIGAIDVKVGSGVTVNAATTVFDVCVVPLTLVVTVTS
jgi:hypothetical protein